MNDTDPNYWFLTNYPYTVGNEVVALVDGSLYMKDLYDRFQQMEPDDQLFYTAWRCTPDQKLRPDWSDRDSRLKPVLLDLIRRKVIVRMLAWYVPGSIVVVSRYIPKLGHHKENKFLVEDIQNSIRALKIDGAAYLDERLPSKIASHHQKSIVLTAKGEPCAYVGGIDISFDRWDTDEHSSPPERQREILEAWHDIQCRVSGPAVRDISENFRDRWNERKPPVRFRSSDIPQFIHKPLRVPEVSKGTVMVQRLRTLACKGLYDFKPGGEQTVREGINRAIEAAKYYIYLEDQYFWPCTTIDFLTRAVQRGVHVFLVLAKAYDLSEPAATAHYEMRKSALDAIRKAGHDKVICCHLEQRTSDTQIYVHSKLLIVDDRFVVIGSANIGRRSHTTDSELSLSMFDSDLIEGVMGGQKVQVCRFAKDLRKRIWKEHLNIRDSDLEDPIAAKAQWPRQGKGSVKVHHAVYHAGDIPSKPITLRDWYRALNFLREFLKDKTQPWPNVLPIEFELIDKALKLLESYNVQFLGTELSDLALGPLWFTPRIGIRDQLKEFLKNKVMNVETLCS